MANTIVCDRCGKVIKGFTELQQQLLVCKVAVSAGNSFTEYEVCDDCMRMTHELLAPLATSPLANQVPA